MEAATATLPDFNSPEQFKQEINVADNDDGPKVVEMQPCNELAGAAEAMKRALPVLLQHMPLQAKMRRAAFQAYIAEGFTEAQALELCRSH